uniref:Uncharacterized protein n=1 Tax=Romanomermis culicivorax TaxID=13658 RepID=A0A915K5H4_ROMCU
MRGDAEKLDFEDDACAPVNANAKFVKKRLQSAAATTLEEIDDAVERSHRNLNRLMDEVTKYTSPQSTPDR